MHYGKNIPSSWTNFPEKYKFTGIDLYLDLTLYQVQRTSYDILNFLGDVGGLLQALQWIALALTSWYSTRYRNRFLMANLY